MDDLDVLLAKADPARGVGEPQTTALVINIAAHARRSSEEGPPGRWWNARRVAVPILIATGALLTGAAVIVAFDPGFYDQRGNIVPADITVPIEYTTASGTEYRCTYVVQFTYGTVVRGGVEVKRELTPELSALVAELAESTKLSGLGKEAYAIATSNPRPDDVAHDALFARALDQAFRDRLPEPLREVPSSSSTDCDGQLE